MRTLILTFVALTCFSNAFSQKKWSLRDCVEYAMEHNISIKQSTIQSQVAEINYKQSKLSRIPSLSFSNGESFRFGKSEDPSTGILENQNYFSVSLGLQSSVQIFNWFSRKNTILADEWTLAAAKAGIEKLKDDISLSVANAYLQALLAFEQQKISDVQVQQTISQLDIVQKQVNAGALPELNAVELEAQLANDSANLISAKGNVEQAKLALKANMNMDAAEEFDMEVPPVDEIPLEPIADLQPENVYALALENLPQQRANEYNLKAAQKNALAAKGSLYPSISAFAGLSTNYGYFRTPRFGQVFGGYKPSGLVIPDGSGDYMDVLQPVYNPGSKVGYITSESLGNQFNSNFGQQIGLSISVPLFNGWQAKANYKRAQLNIKNQEYQNQQDNQTLKQNIYQAYSAAIVAREKFTSARKAVESAQKSYEFSTKRYQVGMLTTLEQLTNQNNLFKAKLQFVLNQFDYVFKMKVLEFYKGQGLKL